MKAYLAGAVLGFSIAGILPERWMSSALAVGLGLLVIGMFLGSINSDKP